MLCPRTKVPVQFCTYIDHGRSFNNPLSPPAEIGQKIKQTLPQGHDFGQDSTCRYCGQSLDTDLPCNRLEVKS